MRRKRIRISVLNVLVVGGLILSACAPSSPTPPPQEYGQLPASAVDESAANNGGEPAFVLNRETGDKGIVVSRPDSPQTEVVWASRAGEPPRQEVVRPDQLQTLEKLGSGVTVPVIVQRYQIPTGPSWTDVAMGMALGLTLGIVGSKMLGPVEKALVPAAKGVGAAVARLSSGEIDDLVRAAKDGRLASGQIDELLRAGRITEEQAQLLRNTQSGDETVAILRGTTDLSEAVRALARGERRTISLDFRGWGEIGFLLPGASDDVIAGAGGGLAAWRGPLYQVRGTKTTLRLGPLQFAQETAGASQLPGEAFIYWFPQTGNIDEIRNLVVQASEAARTTQEARLASTAAARQSGVSALEAGYAASRAEVAASRAYEAALVAGKGQDEALAAARAAVYASQDAKIAAATANHAAEAAQHSWQSPLPLATLANGQVPLLPAGAEVRNIPADGIIDMIRNAQGVYVPAR